MPETKLKLCCDCEHASRMQTVYGGRVYVCRHPHVAVEPTEGRILYVGCAAARRQDGACGPEGTLFEAKP